MTGEQNRASAPPPSPPQHQKQLPQDPQDTQHQQGAVEEVQADAPLKEESSNWRTKLCLLAILVTVEVFLLTNTVIHIFKKFHLIQSINHCPNQTDVQEHDSDDDTSLNNFQDPNNDNVTPSRFLYFSALIYMCTSFLHVPEFAYIFYGLHHFLVKSKWPKPYQKEVMKHSWKFATVEVTCCNCNQQKNHRRLSCRSLLFIIIMCFYIGVSFTAPLQGIALLDGKYSIDSDCLSKKKAFLLTVNYISHTLDFFLNLSSSCVRVMMAVMTVMVGAIWLEVPSDIDSNIHDSIDKEDKEEKARSINFKCMTDFENRLDRVLPIYKIFRSWFVIQWVLCVLEIYVDIAHLLKPVIVNKVQNHNETFNIELQAYVATNTAHDLLSLIIPFVCGLKMNSFLRMYIRRLQEKQETLADRDDTELSLLTNELQIKRRSKCSFAPRIPGTGLSITIESPGFVVSTLFTVMALVVSLVAF